MRWRSGLVDLLNGDTRDPVTRRNQQDDRNLKLLLRFGLRSTSNCLDVGANRGTFLRDIQRLAPLGHHVAYEPVPHLAERLRKEFPEVEVRQRALADQSGQLEFVEFVDPGSIARSGLADHLDPSSLPDARHKLTTVPTERLDDNLPDGWLPDFVKIDVEGAELQVFEGAVDTLRAARPVVAFEHGRLHGTSEEIFRILTEEAGLRVFNMDGEGPLDLRSFLLQLHTRWNWVAHH